MPNDSADKVRQYREDNPEYVNKQRMRERAKKRALIRLKNMNEGIFHQLFVEEMKHEMAKERTRKTHGR